MRSVSIPRGVFVALVVALVGCLIAIAFLLGRESVRSQSSPPEPRVAVEAPSLEEIPRVPLATSSPVPRATPAVARATLTAAPPPPSPTPLARPTATPTPARMAPGPTAAPPPKAHRPPHDASSPSPPHPVAPVAGKGPHPADPAMRAQVAAYFHQMDNIQPGSLSGDPQSVANEVLEGAMNGDMSRFDDLIHKARAGQERARHIHPPPPCAHYHHETLALAEESVAMVESMKQAMNGGDASALMALSARAQAAQSRAEALQREESALKRRYGVR